MDKGKAHQQIDSCLFLHRLLMLRTPPPPLISSDFQWIPLSSALVLPLMLCRTTLRSHKQKQTLAFSFKAFIFKVFSFHLITMLIFMMVILIYCEYN